MGRPVVMGRNAAVSCGHWLAAEAGIEMLRAGGNAIDAAIAALAALTVLKPDACGLGSDVFLQVFDAKTGRVHALNASGPAPALATIEAYGREIPNHGPRACAVPGTVGGWEAALARFGTMKLARVLAPAISYARDGVPVSLQFAAVLERGRDLILQDRGCKAVFRKGDRLPKYGEVFRQPELAETLEAIARDGAAGFYRGPFAKALDADMRARDGFLRSDDLAGYQAEWKDSLCARYRGYDVYEQPPVSQGVIVLEAAKLLEGFPLFEYGDRSADFVHLHTEAIKLAIADRQRYLGDPAFVDAPVERLLNEDFIAQRRRAIDPARANPAPGASDLLQHASETSYGCAVDAQGNGVSFIQSVFAPWGSGYLVPGTGALMNNRMMAFSLDPAHPNALVPGKRTMHTLNTVLVCRDGKLRWLFGTPGAPAQVQSNTQLLTRAIDFGLNPQEAIEAPRSFWDKGAELMLESPYGPDVFEELAKRGHRVADIGILNSVTGGMEMIYVNDHGVREAGADPRREGYAIAF
ncbi:MAG TPA: gamma-glutamyltransferase [Candidatus Binatia bacterium]|nr:gamma-glutamyltransferase [Candidatus Binatia bacterium]